MPLRRPLPSASLVLFALLPGALCAENWTLGISQSLEEPTDGASRGLHFGVDPLDFFPASNSEGNVPVASVTHLYRFESDFDSLPGDISSHEFSVFAPVLPLSYDRLRLGVAVSYRANWFDTSDPLLLPDDTLHAIRLPMIGVYDISDRWLAGAMVMPGYAGDGSSFSDGFSILSALAVGYNYSPRLQLFGGVLYAHGFDETTILPGIGLIWKPADSWSVALLPPFASVSYRFGDDWIFSLVGRYDGPTWNVEADDSGPERDILMREIRVGLKVERRLANRVWAFVMGGANFGRRMEIESLSNTSLQEDDLDAGLFLQGGLNLRF